jgi:hypothetical protein
VSDYSPGQVTIQSPPNLTVSVSGSQTANIDSGSSNTAFGGAFTLSIDTGSANITALTITQAGTAGNLSDVRIFYDTVGDGYGGSESCFNTACGDGQGGTLGSSISGSLAMSSGNTYYLYVVADIAGSVAGGTTVDLTINNPSTDISTDAQNTDTVVKDITGSTTVRPNITSITYPITSPQNGGKTGQSITINGAGFGSICDGANNKVEINTAVVSCTGASFSNTSISITNFQYSSGDSYGGASALKVTIGGTADDALFDFYVYPSITSLSVSEAKEGDTITISGNHFGTAKGANGVVFDDGAERAVSGETWGETSITLVTVPDTISDSVDTVTVRVYQGAGGNNSLSDDSAGFTILPQITGTTSCQGFGVDTAREYDAGDAACSNGLKDGEIHIDGKHFGTPAGTGPLTILGVDTSGYSSWGSNQINTVQVPTAITDNSYAGSIVLTRNDGKSDTYTGFRILPRITNINPSSAAVNDTVVVIGNHLCQSGTCPLSGSRSTSADNVTFYNGVQASDANVTAWSDGDSSSSGVTVVVPSGAMSGNVVVTSSSYASNGKYFTVATSVPNDPTSLGQYKSDGTTAITSFTNYATNERIVAFKAQMVAGVNATLCLQIEVEDVNTAFDGVPTAEETGADCESFVVGSPVTGGVTITGFIDQTKYHWQARVKNNGTGETSNWVVFDPVGGQTDTPPASADFYTDTVAPTLPSCPLHSNLAASSADISWSPSDGMSATFTKQVQYATTTDFASSVCAPGSACGTPTSGLNANRA